MIIIQVINGNSDDDDGHKASFEGAKAVVSVVVVAVVE